MEKTYRNQILEKKLLVAISEYMHFLLKSVEHRYREELIFNDGYIKNWDLMEHETLSLPQKDVVALRKTAKVQSALNVHSAKSDYAFLVLWITTKKE